MNDLEIEQITVYVVGPETERHAWAVDMHTQYMTNTILRARTRGGLEDIAGAASFSEFDFDHGFQNPVRPGRDGKVTVSGLPGLGVEVDWAAIEAATIYKFEETGHS
jgi:L-alanine-DL-glutamate epimerase-like enolase superfamily enzyme